VEEIKYQSKRGGFYNAKYFSREEAGLRVDASAAFRCDR
jgi:hypothetical protein